MSKHNQVTNMVSKPLSAHVILHAKRIQQQQQHKQTKQQQQQQQQLNEPVRQKWLSLAIDEARKAIL